jgi:hypothetical protein
MPIDEKFEDDEGKPPFTEDSPPREEPSSSASTAGAQSAVEVSSVAVEEASEPAVEEASEPAVEEASEPAVEEASLLGVQDLDAFEVGVSLKNGILAVRESDPGPAMMIFLNDPLVVMKRTLNDAIESDDENIRLGHASVLVNQVSNNMAMKQISGRILNTCARAANDSDVREILLRCLSLCDDPGQVGLAFGLSEKDKNILGRVSITEPDIVLTVRCLFSVYEAIK